MSDKPFYIFIRFNAQEYFLSVSNFRSSFYSVQAYSFYCFFVHKITRCAYCAQTENRSLIFVPIRENNTDRYMIKPFELSAQMK